jgi:hypothetical protein
MDELPPELRRLGEALTDATTNVVAARRWRHDVVRKFAACLTAGVVVLAVTAPNPLESATNSRLGLTFASVVASSEAGLGGSCDGAHGGTGRYFQAPQGCAIVRPAPQLR